jgi:mannosyltransferase OCH1-like enzyme
MIPKIIHQVWEGKTEPLPEFLSQLSETWKTNHTQWQYEFWDGDRMENLVNNYFSNFSSTYFSYRYPVQRWDAIRYMILYQMGGLYVDFDFECIEPIDRLLAGKECCFGMDPEENTKMFQKSFIMSNAIMACEPGHPFMKRIINHLPKVKSEARDKVNYVLETTGPFLITDLYKCYPENQKITLFPPELTSPLTKNEMRLFIQGKIDENEMEKKLKTAVAVHYFFGMWL